MDALFDRYGQVVGWADRNGRIMTLEGYDWFWRDAGGNIYDYQGRHQGVWKNGHWRGPDGGVVAWQKGASSMGIIPPLPSLPPLPPLASLESLRPLPSLPPLPPLDMLGWSRMQLT